MVVGNLLIMMGDGSSITKLWMMLQGIQPQVTLIEGMTHAGSIMLVCDDVLTCRTPFLRRRVDMKAVEVTIQNLICQGLDPQLENNPYLCFVYTSFQVRGWAGLKACSQGIVSSQCLAAWLWGLQNGCH